MTEIAAIEPRQVRGGWSLRGYGGGGKGGGGGRSPVEAADSLHSTSYARVLDLLSEGEIQGLVNGLQSVYLDGTPLAGHDGSLNFDGVTADFRAGTQTQDYIQGFPSAEYSTNVGVALKYEAPWTRAVNNTDLSAIRVTLGVNGLSKADQETGDINGYKVDYAIDVQTDGGVWQSAVNSSFNGKTINSYRRTHRIDLPLAKTGWMIRVRRLTPQANSSIIADDTMIDGVTEVIDGKLRYPMSALLGIQVDASQFSSIPARAYHLRGRIIRVPSNYNPQDRTYNGIWDGTFKSAYTNNPAWVFYDLATNERYGLGERMPAAWINKWALYQIGAYCDELVSDGRGGKEPRFTCNVYLQQRGDAYRVLQDLCSIFRGLCYWAAGAVVPVADMPRDPVYTYTQANVIGGKFTYAGSRLRDRNTVALVSYNDMTDMGRQKVVYVQDDDSVARYGIRQVEISAFGCTSEAQARRVGQWALLTARRETDSVTFSVGLDGTLCAPGQIIRVADSARAGRRMGGRIKSATATDVALDAETAVKSGDTLTVIMPSGVAQSRRVASGYVKDGVQHITVSPTFDSAAAPESAWAIDSGDVMTQLYTVMSVTEGDGLTFDVAAVQHEPGKFAAIDSGALLPERPVSVVPANVLPTPTGIMLKAHSVTASDGALSTTVTVSWNAVKDAINYDVEWSRSQSDWVRMPRTPTKSIEIQNAYTGDYIARVRAISAAGTTSSWAYSGNTPVSAKSIPPRNFDTFVVTELDGGMRQYTFAYLTTQPPADLAGAEISYIAGTPENIEWEQMRQLDDGGYYTSGFESSKPEAGLWTFALRARNRSGVLSDGMLIYRCELFENIYVPDLTPPPTPTGFTVTAALTTATLQTDLPAYTEGHGHDRTNFYVAEVTTAVPNPGFAAATLATASPEHIGTVAVELGKTYRFWAKWQSIDGVESKEPAGPATVKAGMVGGHDLGPAIIEAGHLADGSVTASAIAAEAIEATKFAQGIEPVSISTSATLPTVKTTSALVWSGKLYRWDGTKYTATVAAPDLTGALTSAQIADNAITVKQLADAAVQSGKIAQGAVTADAIAALAVTAAKIADSAVTTTKIADAAIASGKLAASAVTADKIAAAAIDATKFAQGIEPVGVVSGSAPPTTKSTSAIVFGGKLYRWDGTKYTSEVDTVDLSGVVSSAQIADNAITVKQLADGAVQAGKIAANAVTASAIAAQAIDATKFASGNEPVGISTAATLPTTKTTTALVWGGVLYRWDGTKYTAAVAAPNITGQLTDAQLAAISSAKLTGQITGTQITDGAIGTPKLAAGAVTAATIAAGAIASDKLAANAVTATAIAAGAITTAKLAAGAVTADTIASNAITTAKIASGAVTATQIAAKAITADNLVIGSAENLLAEPGFNNGGTGWAISQSVITSVAGPDGYDINVLRCSPVSADVNAATNKSWPVATDATRLRQVAAGSVFMYALKCRLVSGNAGLMRIRLLEKTDPASSNTWPVPTNNLDAASAKPGEWVTLTGTRKLPAGMGYMGLQIHCSNAAGTVFEVAEVVMRQMATGELIVDGAITTNSLAAGAVTANKIAANTITAAQIATGSLTAATLAANAVTATAIAAGAITAEKLAALAVTAGKIASNAVTSDTIAANAITAAKIAVGAVTADQIAVKAITAAKLAITDTTAVNIDPMFEDASFWGTDQFPVKQIADGAVGPNVWYGNTASNNLLNNANKFVIDASKTYLFEVWYRALAETDGRAFAMARFFDAAGAVITASGTGWPGTNATQGNHYWPSSSTVTTTEWTRYTVTVGPNGAAKFPAGAVACALGTYMNYMASAPVEVQCNLLRVTEMSRGELVVDGAITAAKIAAGAITAGKIAAGVITSSELAAGAVTAGKIAAWTITATELAAGSVTAAAIAANSVTAVAIAAGAITATKIAAGTITATELAAGAVTAAKIATGTITATQIAAGAITSDKLAANSVIADTIAANAITTAKLAAGAVTAAQIAAGAITADKIVLADLTNRLLGGGFDSQADLNCFSTSAASYFSVDTATTAGSGGALKANAAASSFSLDARKFEVSPGERYRVTFNSRATSNYNGTSGNGKLRFGDQSGALLGAVVWPAATSFTRTLSEFVVPAGVTQLSVRLVFDHTAGTIWIDDLAMRLMGAAELIVDGTITAGKLAANSIAVGTAAIAAGAIVNAMIGNLAADKITTGTLAAARIAAGSIDATKLAANSVTATQIAASAVTADKLQAGAVVAGKIAAGAVTADKISVSSLAAIAANLGTVTAGRIQNAANTAYWNLNATGSTRALQLGSDLYYSDSGGLVVNKANVIGTLQVAGGAISANVGAYASSTLNLGDNDTPANGEIISAAIACSGSAVNVHVAFHCRPYGDIDGFKNRSHDWASQLIRVVNGVETVIFSGWLGYANVRNTNTYGWGLGSVAFNRRDTPGAGDVTYKLRVYNTSGQNGLTVYHRSMILSELKR